MRTRRSTARTGSALFSARPTGSTALLSARVEEVGCVVAVHGERRVGAGERAHARAEQIGSPLLDVCDRHAAKRILQQQRRSEQRRQVGEALPRGESAFEQAGVAQERLSTDDERAAAGPLAVCELREAIAAAG